MNKNDPIAVTGKDEDFRMIPQDTPEIEDDIQKVQKKELSFEVNVLPGKEGGKYEVRLMVGIFIGRDLDDPGPCEVKFDEEIEAADIPDITVNPCNLLEKELSPHDLIADAVAQSSRLFAERTPRGICFTLTLTESGKEICGIAAFHDIENFLR